MYNVIIKARKEHIMPKVLIIRPKNDKYIEIFTKHGFEVEFCENNEEEIVAKGADAEAMIFAPTKFTNELFDKLPNLKIISRTGIGIDTVDMEAATSHGVVVCNCASYGTYDVAQHTVALLLSLVHSTAQYTNAVKANNDWSSKGIPMAMRLSEKRLGIIGFGKIPRWICKMLKGFGIQISVFDPYIDLNVAEELGVTSVSFDELLATSDIISINAPLNSSSYHMINTESIAKMKNSVLIINTGRGPLIDEEALICALESGKIGGAALDVFESEPFSDDSKLRSLNNVILTPHVAWRSTEAVRDLTVEVCENILDFFEGKPLKNQLNLK
jgi:D-3-phosphoglycerate dehydrogenase